MTGLLHPLVRRDGELREASWDEAMDLVVERSRELLATEGSGALGLTLCLRAHESALTWMMAAQAAKAARDQKLLALATECQSETEMQAKWFTTRMKTGAPQALVVA